MQRMWRQFIFNFKAVCQGIHRATIFIPYFKMQMRVTGTAAACIGDEIAFTNSYFIWLKIFIYKVCPVFVFNTVSYFFQAAVKFIKM